MFSGGCPLCLKRLLIESSLAKSEAPVTYSVVPSETLPEALRRALFP